MAIPFVLYPRFHDKPNFPRILISLARYPQYSSTIRTWICPCLALPWRTAPGRTRHRSIVPIYPLGLGKTNFPRVPTVTKWIKSCLLQCFGTFKMPILMFISILVFRPEGRIWNPVRRDTRIYVRRILSASRISKTQLNSSTISPSYKENVRFSTVDFHKLKWSRK